VVADDGGTAYAVQLRNGVLIYTADRSLTDSDIVVTSSRPALAQLVLGASTPEQLAADGDLSIASGEIADLTDMFNLIEPFKFWFHIVTP